MGLRWGLRLGGRLPATPPILLGTKGKERFLQSLTKTRLRLRDLTSSAKLHFLTPSHRGLGSQHIASMSRNTQMRKRLASKL